MAARSSGRGGSSRMAVKRQGAGGLAADCQAASDAAGAAPYLPGAGDALAVGGTQAGGGFRIDLGEAGMQRGRAAILQQLSGFLPRGRSGGRDGGEAVGQRGEIQAGAAGQDGKAPLRSCRRHGGQGGVAPPGDTARFRGGPNTIERMRHAVFILLRWARGDDAQLAIALHCVGIDDDRVKPGHALEVFGEHHGQCRFAAGGGAGDDQRGRFRLAGHWRPSAAIRGAPTCVRYRSAEQSRWTTRSSHMRNEVIAQSSRGWRVNYFGNWYNSLSRVLY